MLASTAGIRSRQVIERQRAHAVGEGHPQTEPCPCSTRRTDICVVQLGPTQSSTSRFIAGGVEVLEQSAMDRTRRHDDAPYAIAIRDARASSDNLERRLTSCRDSPRRPTSGSNMCRNFRLPVVFIPGITIVEIMFYLCQSTVVDQPHHRNDHGPTTRIASSKTAPEVDSASDHRLALTLDHRAPFVDESSFPFQSSSSSSSSFTSSSSLAGSRRRYRRVPASSVDASGRWSPTVVSGSLVYRSDKRHEVWRYVMYMFVHAGWQHLLLNAFIQLIAGIPLEIVHGAFRTGLIYMTGVLAGSLATSVFDADVVLVGSSSGVYAIVAAHLPSIWLNYADVELAKLKLITVCVVALAEVGLTVRGCRASYDSLPSSALTTASRSSFTRPPSTSNIAHLTGAVAGILAGLLVLGPVGHRRRIKGVTDVDVGSNQSRYRVLIERTSPIHRLR